MNLLLNMQNKILDMSLQENMIDTKDLLQEDQSMSINIIMMLILQSEEDIKLLLREKLMNLSILNLKFLCMQREG